MYLYFNPIEVNQSCICDRADKGTEVASAGEAGHHLEILAHREIQRSEVTLTGVLRIAGTLPCATGSTQLPGLPHSMVLVHRLPD